MLTIVLQAGGASRRMGQDKGLVHFLGKPLIERLIERLAPIAQELILVTNHPEAYAYLNLPATPDAIPARGALGGLYTALLAAAQPLVAVIACDMPFASPALLAVQRDLLVNNAAFDAVIPRTASGNEPFHGVYRRAACLPLVEAAIQADLWRMDAWYGKANLKFLEPPELWQHVPDRFTFLNVNTPEDLLQAETLARSVEPTHPPAD